MTFSAGTYKLTNVKAGVALDLSEGDGQTVIAFSPHGGPNQQWQFEDVGDGNYSIKNVGLGKYLTFPDDAVDGKQVIATDGPRPWEVRVGHEGVNVKDERESLRIFHPGTDKNIDLKDHGDATAGNTVQLWSQTPGKGQAWYFESV
ncbi:carbohydrate-binding module family 13 protein [Ceratobasidium sp. AG-I]|nr:carbohydrate-binding module family 13 protein [Ceratobasidium sp. AG-I]